jgi:hypothetical protein
MLYGLVAGTVSLTEAGKKIAARNAARIKAAIAAMQEMLAEVGDVEDADVTEAGREMAEAVLRKSDTLDARREALHRAVREKMIDPLYPEARPWVWIRDVFDAAVVVETGEDGGLVQYPYSVDNTVEPPRYIIGEGEPVQLAYVPIAESGADPLDEAFVALSEGAIRKDGTATIKLITAGWGSSGYYPADVLKRDGPRAFAEGTKMFADHPTAAEEAGRPERSIKDLAAVLTSAARWEDVGADGPGLYAEAKVYEAWRKPLDEMAADTGVSIRALGRARMGEAEGRKGPIVEEIARSKSVDFVTDAGRGGRIVPLAEAARNRNPQGPRPGNSGGKPAKEDHMPLTAEEQALITNLQESVSALNGQVAALTTQNQRLSEAGLVADAAGYATQLLAGAALPDVTKARLVEAVKLKAPAKDGTLDREAFRALVEAAAKDEATYLSNVGGLGHVRLGGGDLVLEEAGDGPSPEEVEKKLAATFQSLGLSESAAQVAAAGR